jgi:NAD(P)-dependent dehydrogenase (short-subunit alcohol dehydrogenase family)
MADGSVGGRGALAVAAVGAALVGRELLGRLREETLEGQVALITGSSKGLGYLLARELAGEGCKLVICARDEVALERARRSLEELGAEVLAVPCDVSDRAQVESMIARAVDRFGRVDILVNNAGIIQVGPVETHTLADFEEAHGIIFWGAVYPTLALLPQMLERGHGHIVNVTSVGGKVSVPHLLPYNCAKFAQVGFSEGLAAEVAGQGVKVTTIAPGLMRTGSFLNAYMSGKQELEYAWFAIPDSLPLLSMAAPRAARQIVRATKRGQPELIVGIQASMLARFHGLFPGLTIRILGVVDRLLPKAGGEGATTTRAEEVQRRTGSRLLSLATALGRSANRRYQQHEQ